MAQHPTLTAAQQELAIQQQAIIRSQAIVGQIINTVQNSIDTNSGTFPTVGTVSDLANVAIPPVTTNLQVFLSGFATPGDGGGGLFFWDPTVPPSGYLDDNIGIVIRSNTNSTGRWRRSGYLRVTNSNNQTFETSSGPVDVKWFGAKGDGATNDYSAISSALAALNIIISKTATTFSGKTDILLISEGVYKINSSISFPQSVTVKFNGSMFYIGTGAQITINGSIDASDQSRIFDFPSTTIGGIPAVATQPVIVPDQAPNKYLTPYHFGAAGDGVTDDQLALNVCFNATTRVFIPPGTFIPIAGPIVASQLKYHVWGTGDSSIIKMTPVTGFNPTYPNFTGLTPNLFNTGVLVFASLVPSSQQEFIEIDHIQFVGNKNIYTTSIAQGFGWTANMIYFAPSGTGPYTSIIDCSVHHCLFQHGQLDTIWGEADRMSFCDNTILDWGYLTDTNHPASIANLNVVQMSATGATVCRNFLYQVAGGIQLATQNMVCTDNVIDQYLTNGIYVAEVFNIRSWTIANNVVKTTCSQNFGGLLYNGTGTAAAGFSFPTGTIVINTQPVYNAYSWGGAGAGTLQVVTTSGTQTVSYANFDGYSTFSGVTGWIGSGTVSLGAAIYNTFTTPIGGYRAIIGALDDSSSDPLPQGLTVTGNQVWFDDDGTHTSYSATGVDVGDVGATITGNEVVFHMTASTTGSNQIGYLTYCDVYSPTVHFTSNKVTFVQTASTPSMSQCQGFASSLLSGVPGQVLTLHSSNNKAVGLAPTGHTSIGVAYNYSIVGASSGGDLVVYSNGDWCDGGLPVIGGFTCQIKQLITMAVDTRSANINPNHRIDSLALVAPNAFSIGDYALTWNNQGPVRRGDLAEYPIPGIVLSSGIVYVPNASVTQFSVIDVVRTGLYGPPSSWGALSAVPVAPWQPSTFYTAGSVNAAVFSGQFVSNGGNVYQCYSTGISASSGGPTGTGGNITDNTAHWKYLNAGGPGFYVLSSNSGDNDQVQAGLRPY